MSAPSSCVSEGFRNWTNRMDSRTPGLCRSSVDGMASARLRSGEKHFTTRIDDDQDISEDYSVEHSGVTNADVAVTRVCQRLPRHPLEEGHSAAAAARCFSRQHSNDGKPRTAQLTVFYAGVVNVYDDVPSDRAEAIMLLAGKPRTRASLNDSPVYSGSCAPEHGVPASTPINQPVSRAGSPSQLTRKSECVPNIKRPSSIATRVELPQARKASLARFLERRKDRLRAAPYTVSTMESNCATPNSSWLSTQTSSAISSPSRSK